MGTKKAVTMAMPPSRGMGRPCTFREVRAWSRIPKRRASSRTSGVTKAPTSTDRRKAAVAVRMRGADYLTRRVPSQRTDELGEARGGDAAVVAREQGVAGAAPHRLAAGRVVGQGGDGH